MFLCGTNPLEWSWSAVDWAAVVVADWWVLPGLSPESAPLTARITNL